MYMNNMKDISKKTKDAMVPFEDLNNRLVALHTKYGYDATDLIMIMGFLSARVVNAIKRNCGDKKEAELKETEFFVFLKHLIDNEPPSNLDLYELNFERGS